MFVWDEKKRAANLLKHGFDFDFDFEDANLIYFAPGKSTWKSVRHGEERYADVAFVEFYGLYLTLIYTERVADIRVISLRQSSRKESVDHSQFQNTH